MNVMRAPWDARLTTQEIGGLMGPSEAARELGLSAQYVTGMCRRGQLRGVLTSLGWLVDPASVAAEKERRLTLAAS